ncbi:hypothetical protein NQZ68_019200 [Dissostichus eleginoides]|nr:hypothetical protein NQZ68_019200 [Dissostichus eleginoides]
MKPFQQPTRDPYFIRELCNSWALGSLGLLSQLTRAPPLRTNTHGMDKSCDAARMREDGEQRVEQAVKAQTELEKKLAQMERKTLLTLNNREQLHREQLEAERQLKEQQYAELTVEREQAEEQLSRQCEEQLRRQCEEQRALSQKELQQVQEEVARLKQDFNQSLLQAESEKQQALSQKEAEKAALTEKLAALQQELATAGMKLECMQREARNKHEQDKNATAVLRSELHDLRSQFEESLNSHENAKKSLIEQEVHAASRSKETGKDSTWLQAYWLLSMP